MVCEFNSIKTKNYLHVLNLIGCHDKYGGDSTNSTGFGLSPEMGDTMGVGNSMNIHYNQHNDRHGDANGTSSYNNYDRLGGLYDHMQSPYDKKDTNSGGFLSTDSANKVVEVSNNKNSLIRTFPNLTKEAGTPQQMPLDKSPDVIPHGIGKFF